MKYRSALVAIGALAATLLVTPAAQASTKGFEVMNLSQYSMLLTTTETGAQEDGTPKNAQLPFAGVQIGPGQSVRFELDDVSSNTVVSRWNLLRPDGSTAGTAEVHLALSLHLPYWGASSADNLIAYTHENGSDVRVLDVPGTVITAASLTHDQQWAVIDGLCGNSEARCSYSLKGEREATFAPQVLDNRFNQTCQPAKQSVTRVSGDDVTKRWEESVTVKGDVLEILKVAVTQRYGEVSTSRNEVSSVVDYMAPSYFAFTSTLQVPVWRHTGTYSVQTGNTRWQLDGVTYETLRDDLSQGSQVDVTVRPMTPTEMGTSVASC